ncbi:hypothetical protein BVC71_12510 [Marivivens niveibacter]|uniref:Anti-sigma factor n=1 Tax=Marivivens niveibacter TaxID=1930667 RepID=A0A251WXF1_9RHOB|nr:hypothetical protein [Marivivens niveibacter]OUD08744.1 hypothetical protein BVC71_12510 [Marivivens niveibacter]
MTDQTDDIALAAEYSLGLLDGNARDAFAARISSDPTLAAMVDDWDAQFSELNGEFETVQAPNVMPQIEQQLFGQTRRPLLERLFAGVALWKLALLGVLALVLVKAILLITLN